MAYEQKAMRRQKVQYDDANDDNPLVYQLTKLGAKVTPTSATITIYRPGNSTALVSGAAMTVDGTLLKYSVNTTTEASWPIGEGYRGELAITAGGETTPAVIIFDVVRWVLKTNLGFDQLVALDDSLRGDAHNGDEDFSPLIEAMRDELQSRIETKIHRAERVNESWFVDASLAGICHRYLVLSQYHFNRGNTDKSAHYMAQFDRLFEAVLATYPIDSDQDGEEEPNHGGVGDVRFIT